MIVKEIILASNNANKIREIGELLGEFNIKVRSLKELNLGDPVEDGKDFNENSLIKAKFGFEKTGLPALADDSGFCVDSLNNFPGLYSARFEEACGSYEEAFRILDKCINPINKKAFFITSLAFIYKDTENKIVEKTFEGKIDGEFVYPGRGNNGFGYCPVFLPNGYNQTFGEMEDSLRKSINHRKIALNKFLEFFRTIINK